jgi:succinate dehydrogenase / fumarate reductase cytochrome b subunit
MLPWLQSFLRSSIGKKASMAVSGLLLVGFLIAHLAGNLTLFADGNGQAFDAYAAQLRSLGPLLLAAELGLLALFLTHIAFAAWTTWQNRRARSSRYALPASHGGRTFASGTMPLTGLVVLFFLVVHLVHFRFDAAFAEGPAALVRATLSQPLPAAIYLLGALALTIHLVHAIPSALQTLGWHHPRWTPVLARTGLVLAVVLGLGFASFPVYALLRW